MTKEDECRTGEFQDADVGCPEAGAEAQEAPESDGEWEFVDGPTGAAGRGGPLSAEAFGHFAPLLAASQEYAGLAGCRFCPEAFFRGLGGAAAAREPEGGGPDAEGLAARRRAEGEVRRFRARLAAREPALLREAEAAHRVVMAESVRNAMIATFRELDLWPPLPRPPCADDGECAFEDLDAPVPEMAQRTWNDEVRRSGGATREPRLAATASYLVDFVHAAGVELPAADEQMALFREFQERVDRWQSEQQALPQAAAPPGPDEGGLAARAGGALSDGFCVLCGAGSPAAPAVRLAGKVVVPRWARSWPEALWALSGAAFVGAAAAAGLSLMKRALLEDQQAEDAAPCLVAEMASSSEAAV